MRSIRSIDVAKVLTVVGVALGALLRGSEWGRVTESTHRVGGGVGVALLLLGVAGMLAAVGWIFIPSWSAALLSALRRKERREAFILLSPLWGGLLLWADHSLLVDTALGGGYTKAAGVTWGGVLLLASLLVLRGLARRVPGRAHSVRPLLAGVLGVGVGVGAFEALDRGAVLRAGGVYAALWGAALLLVILAALLVWALSHASAEVGHQVHLSLTQEEAEWLQEQLGGAETPIGRRVLGEVEGEVLRGRW